MALTHFEALKLAYDYYVLRNRDGDPREHDAACYCPHGQDICVPCKLKESIESTTTPQGVPYIPLAKHQDPIKLRDEFAVALMPMLLRSRLENASPFIQEALKGLTLDELCDKNHPLVKKVTEIAEDGFLAAAEDAYRAARKALTARIAALAETLK